MKILQISSHYNQGGAARIVACIHRELLARGQQSYVAYGRGAAAKEENIRRIDTVPEVYASALFSRLSGLNGWGNYLATRRLLSFMERIRPDVIHMHTLHGYYLNMPMLFRYLNERDIPCVWTFHDCHAFVGNCGYFFDCERWKEGCGKCPYLKQYPASLFFDFTGYMWRRKKELFTGGSRRIIVTPSDWLTGEAEKSFLGQYPCMTIRNGIDVHDTFYPRDRKACRKKYGFSETEKLALGIAVGYGDPRKGAAYIIRMAKALEKEAKVILIGWEEKNNEMLKGLSNIIAMPPTPDADMLAEYYSLADVFVLPSLAENYATVSLESMACGTPVVGFQAGGIPEQLIGQRGIAVPAGDGEAFTRAVRQALSPKSNLLRGEELAAIIRKENSVEEMTGQYLQVYERLLKVRE
ncbi:MAG: glycosyltransferase [Roseburia sp.]|nr:glycosyltransferase [Roseburia sp.]